MAELDITRLPQGELAARELIAAIAANGDQVEHHYLEVKSSLDFEKKSDVAKIAKFILGAANRMPDLASRAFDGRAIMVLGVGTDTISGVAPVEVMEIATRIKPYLSAEGPRWDLQRLSIEGSENQVLLIIVDPPVFGQDLFVCHKDGDGLANGAIYIRSEGQTRPAHADEIKQLVGRGKQRQSPVSLDVRTVGSAHRYSVHEADSLDDYITKTRNRLLEARRREIRKQTSRFGFSGMEVTGLAAIAASMSTPEHRTSKEYEAEIADWEQAAKDAWPVAVDRVSAHAFGGVAFEISNGADTYLPDMQLSVHLEGAVEGIEWGSPGADLVSLNSLPKPPRPWGPRQKPMGPEAYRMASFMSPTVPSHDFTQSGVTFRNSGSVTVDIAVGDLRPRQTHRTDSDDLVLIVRSPELSSVRGTWQATARDRDEVFEGELQVDVEPPQDLTAMLRVLLRLDPAPESL